MEFLFIKICDKSKPGESIIKGMQNFIEHKMISFI